MNYGEIKNFDVGNGLGIRVSLFVSGCRNHCPGCFNEMTWDFKYGKEFTDDTLNYILDLLKSPQIDGFSLLGGEPFEEENQKEVVRILETIKKEFPNKDIWCWTGYTLDKDLIPSEGKKHTEYTNRILNCIDVIIDGRFIMAQRNLMLKFRGSENQRVIDLKKSLKENKIVLYID